VGWGVSVTVLVVKSTFFRPFDFNIGKVVSEELKICDRVIFSNGIQRKGPPASQPVVFGRHVSIPTYVGRYCSAYRVSVVGCVIISLRQ
jgi:hypothetical protein